MTQYSRNPREAAYLDERRIQRFATVVGTFFAVAFVVLGMWALWAKRDNVKAQFGIVTGFVFAFAGWLGFFTSSTRKEVVTATAVYGAVLVVFVSKG